jgi:hypothetical protein
MKLKATRPLLDEYPQLAAAGLKVGDDFEIMAGALNLLNEGDPQTMDGDEPPPPDDPGGNNPPKKPIIP